MTLNDVAPRLARARDQYEAEWRWNELQERYVRNERHRIERLIAHRELQLVRAYHKPRGGYIAARQRKLDAAQQMLKRLRPRPWPGPSRSGQ